MRRQTHTVSRRAVLTTGLAALAVPGFVQRAEAAEWTAAEKASVQAVNDFCAAWSNHDLPRIASFFADNAAYRATETAEPVKGREAVTNLVKSFVDRVQRFEVI